MYYSQDSIDKINAHLKKVHLKKLLGFGPARELAAALYACVTENAYDKRSAEQKRNGLRALIEGNGKHQLYEAFAGRTRGALKLLQDGKTADIFQKVWERCYLYTFSC